MKTPAVPEPEKEPETKPEEGLKGALTDRSGLFREEEPEGGILPLIDPETFYDLLMEQQEQM